MIPPSPLSPAAEAWLLLLAVCQALLSEKMVRKLKENVIQRMKPKTGKAAASASSSGTHPLFHSGQ